MQSLLELKSSQLSVDCIVMVHSMPWLQQGTLVVVGQNAGINAGLVNSRCMISEEQMQDAKHHVQPECMLYAYLYFRPEATLQQNQD